MSLARLLALNRTVGVVLLAVLLFGLGRHLWEPFLSVYFSDLRDLKRQAEQSGELTPTLLWLVGLSSLVRNLFEAGCYVGGGTLTARLGDRGSLLLFGVLSVSGYVLFLVAPGPITVAASALLILGWEPLSVPVTFTTVGSTVDRAGQGMAFAVQSIQKRLPKILGPLIAGYVLKWAESSWDVPRAEARVGGMQLLVVGAFALGVASLAVQAWFMPHRAPPPPGPPAGQLLRGFHPTLKGLLLAETFTRWCDHLVRDFVVLYLVLVRKVEVDHVGELFALQNTVALITYLPIGRLTRTAGLQPFVGLTFVFFALFPLTLILVPGGWWLALAFVVYGLREIGEPARKAMITGLLPEEGRARGVGLYWGVRDAAMSPASLAGAALWIAYRPEASFAAAFVSGCVGFVLYLLARRWLSA